MKSSRSSGGDVGRHGRIDLLLCGGGHRADEQRDEREARRADGESQHQSSTGLRHGKQEVVAAVAAGGNAGQAAVVFDARRALGGHARRFEFATACLAASASAASWVASKACNYTSAAVTSPLVMSAAT